MLLFAAALRYLPRNEVIPGLSVHHHVVMEELAESAVRLVTTNEMLLGTLEHLEAMLLEGFYHIDGGNIRRGWITMRRAVMAGQLMGLHRPGHYRFNVITKQHGLDPASMWVCIVSMDRVLSLLLDLPAATGTITCVAQDAESLTTPNSRLNVLVLAVTAKILDRNQIQPSQKALDLTREIDRELVKITEEVPSAFWRPPAFEGLKEDSIEAVIETKRNWDQLCYYTLVNQLHLPYMMCPSHGSQSVYSRIACVNASREILTRQIAIRTFNPITPCCRMGDFMALIAGMTLILGHIVSHCQKESNNLLVHQRLGDRAIVERALECMQSASELRDDVLAARCAVLLEDLLAVEADAAQGQDYRAHKSHFADGDHEDERSVLIVKVPYVGTIRIAREGVVTVAPHQKGQDQGGREGITIGGMGTLQVRTPRTTDQSSGHGTPEARGTRAVVPQAQNVPTPQGQAPLMTAGLFPQEDQIFPDPAASMDDWLFQGTDTAFFDVLMRGAVDPQPSILGAEGWDLGTFQ